MRIGSRLIIEIVNNVGRCAGDNKCIHSMVTMVDTLFHKSALQIERQACLEHGFAILTFPMPKILGSCKIVKPDETRINQFVPHILQAPIFFQRIGNAARTHHHMFRTRFSFSLLSNHIRKQCHHRFTDIACVVELSRIKIGGQVFHQQLASLCGVVCIVSRNVQLIGLLVKDALCFSTEFLNKLHTQIVSFELIYIGLTNNLI